MSTTVNISSADQFRTLLGKSNVVVADFYADWCGPCKVIAPAYEQLSRKFSKPNAMTFTKVNVDSQQAVARQYGVSAMPTFLIFRSGTVINTIRGADPRALTSAVEAAAKFTSVAKLSSSGPGHTLGGSTPASGRSISRPAVPSLQSWFNAIVAFFGLYIISLFSVCLAWLGFLSLLQKVARETDADWGREQIDPYTAAEASSFNIHRAPPVPISAAARAAGVKPPTAGRKVGTMADIST
ncbi:MAG: hypothetical protein M1818_001568 [Claussenomyces sp. TS43310]|nr:MAG: hypothetical protein M1818_001568 [Claussenomyces sp. TS43310]